MTAARIFTARGLMIALGLCSVAAARSAAAQGPGKAGKQSKAALSLRLPELCTWELENGLRVAFMPSRSAPVVSVQLWYHAGSKDEPPGRHGVARMFERFMFQGSEHLRPEEHARLLDRLGGYSNALVTEDATGYQNTVPKEYLELAVQLEAERMRNLVFRKETVAAERNIVKEEIRRQANDPLKRGVWQFLDTAYTVHPYAREAMGQIDDLAKISMADLKKFYDSYYRPNNALLVVTGDVAEADVRAAVDKWFAGIPRGDEPPRPADELREPKQGKKRRRVLERAEIGLVFAGYHIPAAKHDDIYALQVLSLLLGVGDSSRLHRRLVDAEGVARDVGCSAIVREHPGLFVLFGAFELGPQGDKVEAALLDEIAKLHKRAPSAAELRKAKNLILSSFVFGLEGSAQLGQQIGVSWILTGDPGQFLRDIGEFEAITARDVQRVAKKYLVQDNLTIVVIPPARSGGRK